MNNSIGPNFQIKRGTNSSLMKYNVVIKDGELIYDKTNKKLKIGDGGKRFSELPTLNKEYSLDVNEFNEIILKEDGVQIGDSIKIPDDSGYYTLEISQPDGNSTMNISFTKSNDKMPDVDDVIVDLPAGPKGESGVWTGSDTPPEGYDVWIDPNGGIDDDAINIHNEDPLAHEDIREEISQLSSEIEDINYILSPIRNESLNIFDGSNVTVGQIRNFNVGQSLTSFMTRENSWTSNQVWSCKKGDIIRSNHSWYIQIVEYDSDGMFVQYTPFDSTGVYTISHDNSAYFIIQAPDDTRSRYTSLMITKNNDMPGVYTPYTTAITLEQIGENQKAIAEITEVIDDIKGNGVSKAYFTKPFVVLSFDAFNLTDNRFNIVHGEYGYKATVAHKTVGDIDINKKVLSAGWDIGLYQLDGNPARVSGQYNAAVSENPTDEILQAWDNYVKTAVDDAAEAMAYNPVVWLSSQGCSCYGLEQALKKYGIPMCRGSYNPTYSNDWEYAATDLPTMTVAVKQTLMPSTLEACKTNIAEAVANGAGVAFLTHGIYATDDEANSHYGITEACLRSFLDTVKSYVDAGQLEVVTYRDIYAKYYPEKAKELDYNRTIKMITGINVLFSDGSGDIGTGSNVNTEDNTGGETTAYTNVIKTSVGSDGAIFNNGKGWADNSRIGSGGIYLGNGSYYVTGHIEINPNIDNVVRLKNITFDNTTSNNYAFGIFFFNESCTRQNYDGKVNVVYPDAMTFLSPVSEGTNIVQFTIPASLITDKTVKYFAICCSSISDASIITINEPIE